MTNISMAYILPCAHSLPLRPSHLRNLTLEMAVGRNALYDGGPRRPARLSDVSTSSDYGYARAMFGGRGAHTNPSQEPAGGYFCPAW